MKKLFILLMLTSHILQAQTDYDQLSNWYFHPELTFNFLETYDLDIAVIDKHLEIDSIIPIENNAVNNTGVDVFWVHPTQLTNPPVVATTIPIAEQNTTLIGGIILAQGALLAKYGRFYAPKYRQASPSAFLGFGATEEERADALMEAYSDVKAAFMHYLDNHNNGNKIIIAGHSQGSFLLAMLLRDLFDNDPQLRAQLLTASLGGMGYVYSSSDTFQGGWWENIPLCTLPNECGCVHYWRSYEDFEDIPLPNSNLPSFNQVLVDSGLVYRATDLSADLFRQDSLFYGATSSPLRYYITPDASYNLAPNYNIIAFDSLYTAQFKRESNSEVGISLELIEYANDLRPNDIDSMQNNPFFSAGDLHTKDYHIYSWALLAQIDSKLQGCFTTTNKDQHHLDNFEFSVYPNPSHGRFTIKLKDPNITFNQGTFIVVNTLGQVVQTFEMTATEKVIDLNTKGVYFIISEKGYHKIIVN